MWKDETSRSRGAPHQAPRVWQHRTTYLRVVVHRLHNIDDVWFLTTAPALFEDRELKAKDVEAAKQEALDLIDTRLREVLGELRKDL